jgi:hypothetical protein
MLITRHPRDFAYTPRELQALFRVVHAMEADHGYYPNFARNCRDSKLY